MSETETMQRPLSVEELNESLARRDRPKPKQSSEEAMFRLIGKFVADEIKKATAPLKERITQLEKQIEKIEQRKWVGVWSGVGKYYEQQMVTLDGSIFCCVVAETTQRPGSSPDWVLCVKRGQDASRRPTMPPSRRPTSHG